MAISPLLLYLRVIFHSYSKESLPLSLSMDVYSTQSAITYLFGGWCLSKMAIRQIFNKHNTKNVWAWTIARKFCGIFICGRVAHAYLYYYNGIVYEDTSKIVLNIPFNIFIHFRSAWALSLCRAALSPSITDMICTVRCFSWCLFACLTITIQIPVVIQKAEHRNSFISYKFRHAQWHTHINTQWKVKWP